MGILYIVDFNCLSVTDPSFTMPFESPSNFFTETPDGNDKEFSKFPTPNGNTEEHWYSLRRCSRCKQFYTEAENQDPSVKCYFHTGKYTDTNRVRDGVFVGWSCCRFTSADYHNLDCKGCNTSEQHAEDQAFTHTMKLFPFDPNANRDEQLRQVINSEAEKVTQSPKTIHLEELFNDPNYFAHKVTMLDTLAGLALKYKTTRENIKRINRLPNDMVIQREFIFIPKTPGVTTPAPSEDTLSESGRIHMFVSKTGCAKEEARYYLEESKWNVDEALSNWREDMSWSKKN